MIKKSALALIALLTMTVTACAHGDRDWHYHQGYYYHPHYYYSPYHPYYTPYYYGPPVVIVPAPSPPPAVIVVPQSAPATCRNFDGNATIDASGRPFFGTACQGADGQWYIR